MIVFLAVLLARGVLSTSGDCKNTDSIFVPLQPEGIAPISTSIREACSAEYTNEAEQSQQKSCENLAYATDILIATSKSRAELIEGFGNLVFTYIRQDPLPPKRRNFAAKTTLAQWGTLKELVECHDRNAFNVTAKKSLRRSMSTFRQLQTHLRQGDCSTADDLLLNAPLQATNAPLVYLLKESCIAYFKDVQQQSQLLPCVEMASGVGVIIVSAHSRTLIPQEVKNWLTHFVLNDPWPPTRKDFILNATLGKWGTLMEFISCNIGNGETTPPPTVPPASTTTTATTTTETTATTTNKPTTTTPYDQCKAITVILQKGSNGKSLLENSILGICTDPMNTCTAEQKRILDSSANQIGEAINAGGSSIFDLLNGIYVILINSVSFTPAESLLLSSWIGEWGTVRDFYKCMDDMLKAQSRRRNFY
ncbi:unnamed protein product [Toxocara canis]|uniref:Secreted protein n=1 Tax=Toxocara canis TaxID=6265 RepID=A0A183UJ04_TOXCA|nr:unnamed protein product [Toxocara canis]